MVPVAQVCECACAARLYRHVPPELVVDCEHQIQRHRANDQQRHLLGSHGPQRQQQVRNAGDTAALPVCGCIKAFWMPAKM